MSGIFLKGNGLMEKNMELGRNDEIILEAHIAF